MNSATQLTQRATHRTGHRTLNSRLGERTHAARRTTLIGALEALRHQVARSTRRSRAADGTDAGGERPGPPA